MVRSDYKYSNSADMIKRLIEKDEKHKEAYNNFMEYAHSEFYDDPKVLSGWGHNFACPNCATMFDWEYRDRPNPPKEYVCKHCGKVSSGEDYEGGWMFHYRGRLTGCFHYSTIGFILGDEKATKYFYDFLNFYCDHYEEFPEHGKWVGKGKVNGQSLDEAVWGASLCRVLMACKDLLSNEYMEKLYTKFFKPLANLIFPQAKRTHNISMWIMCCVGSIGVLFNDKELIDKALNSEFGLRNQIKQGFTEDGMWRECSIVYHYYVAQCLGEFLPVYATYSKDDEIFDIYEKIFSAPLAFSNDGKTLQALNDGWYPLNIDNYLWLEQNAARVIDNPLINRDINNALKEDRLPISFFFELDYELSNAAEGNEKDDRSLSIYKSTNFGFVHNPFYMILKSGVVCSTHMHLDYLSIMLPPFSDDLGTPSYSHPLMNSWFKDPPAHNSICIDGTQQWKGENDIVHSHIDLFDDSIVATINENEWNGVNKATRTLMPKDNKVIDTTIIETNDEHTFDWFFHSFGDANYNVSGTEYGPLSQLKTYSHLKDIKKMNCEDVFIAQFAYKGKILKVEIPLNNDIEVFTMLSPSNPPDEYRNTIVLRQHGKSCKFEAIYSIETI